MKTTWKMRLALFLLRWDARSQGAKLTVTFDAARGEPPQPLQPSQGRRHFGCPTCGNVRLLPYETGENVPWCLHHGGEYTWGAPEDPKSDWTRMVPVEVFR